MIKIDDLIEREKQVSKNKEEEKEGINPWFLTLTSSLSLIPHHNHTITSIIHIERSGDVIRTFAILSDRYAYSRGMRRDSHCLPSKGYPRVNNTANNTRAANEGQSKYEWKEYGYLIRMYIRQTKQ